MSQTTNINPTGLALGQTSSTIVKFTFALVALLLLASCGKDKDYSIGLEDGVSVVIKDLAGDVEASVSDGADGKEKRPFYTFLFRFKDQQQIWIKNKKDSVDWLKSDQWDLAFTGPYNAEVFVNDATNSFNPGFEGAAKNTAVILVKQPYQNVNLAPSDEEFDRAGTEKIGWAANMESLGWFQYSLNTHIMQALTNRTYVIRLPDNKYAKLQIVNAYKGNPTAVTNMNWPSPYYTFRYFVQEDGSKNLNTNNQIN